MDRSVEETAAVVHTCTSQQPPTSLDDPMSSPVVLDQSKEVKWNPKNLPEDNYSLLTAPEAVPLTQPTCLEDEENTKSDSSPAQPDEGASLREDDQEEATSSSTSNATTPRTTMDSLDVGGRTTFDEIIAQLNDKDKLDEAVKEALPNGAELIYSKNHGQSTWTVTGHLIAREPDGVEKEYFIKIASGEHGGVILKGEWESAKEIYRIVPGLIPEPYALGRFKSQKRVVYFYLSEFIHFETPAPPNPNKLAEGLAALHKNSQSPNGKFGFHVTTCDGKMPHIVEWEESWAVFFAKLLRNIFNIDLEANGPWPEMERAAEQVFTKVIPRLLGNLSEPDGTPLKPCLLHGDVWEPNMGVNAATGQFMLYDVGSYYGHNEMELGQWRTDICRHLGDKKSNWQTYTDAYALRYNKSQPQAEFEDRNMLYSLKSTLNYSAGHPNCGIRQSAYNSMCYLCQKYAPIDGIDEYDPQKDPLVTGKRIELDFDRKD